MRAADKPPACPSAAGLQSPVYSATVDSNAQRAENRASAFGRRGGPADGLGIDGTERKLGVGRLLLTGRCGLEPRHIEVRREARGRMLGVEIRAERLNLSDASMKRRSHHLRPMAEGVWPMVYG